MTSHLTQRQIALIGFRDPFRSVITEALKQQYNIVLVADNPLDDAALPAHITLVCQEDSFLSQAIDSPVAYRKRYFLWNPIVIIDRFPDVSDGDGLWEIRRQSPPLNIKRLVACIEQAMPFPESRQREVLMAALYELREYLLYQHQLGQGNLHTGDEKVRRDIADTLEFLRNAKHLGSAEAFEHFEKAADALLALPTHDEAALQYLLPIVVDADTAARETQQPAELRSKLHQLSNTVRLALSKSHSALLMRISDLYGLLLRLPFHQVDTLSPGLGEPLMLLRDRVLAVAPEQSSFSIDTFDVSQLGEMPIQCAALIARALLPSLPLTASTIQRIVVIEDDPGWQSHIQATLTTMGLTLPIETAGTIEDGKRLLKQSEGGTLALVDLGLPKNSADARKNIVDMEGGLKLLKTCVANPSLGIRAIVLTAAENFADAVRDALASGIDAADYIQKDPRTWEEQLRSRVQLAVQSAPPTNLPTVDVFRCTARLIRLDGVEIALERKPYALFEHLASHARMKQSVAKIRAALTTPGDRDITPVMSKEQEKLLLQGEEISPFDLLTPKHLQDYLYDLRKLIEQELKGLGITRDYGNLITYHPEEEAYCLNADVRMVERFDQLARPVTLRKVLVVEDHPQWQASLTSHLQGLGFDVRAVQTLDDAKQAISNWAPHYVTLDLQIPRNSDEFAAGMAHEEHGIAVMRYLKERLQDAGVVVLTSIAWKDAVMLELLRAGVTPHDYIAKQWDDALGRVAQSLWRLAIRRERGSQINPGMSPDTISHIHIDSASDIIEIAGCPVKPYPDGRKVLLLLAQSPNMPVQRDAIVDMLWPDPDTLPEEYEAQLNTIMSRLRKAISDGTHGVVDGKQLIRNADGVYWLQGIVSYRE